MKKLALIPILMLLLFGACRGSLPLPPAGEASASPAVEPPAPAAGLLPEALLATAAPTPLPGAPQETLDRLNGTRVSSYDLLEVACRLEKKCNIPRTMKALFVPQLGEQRAFWTSNQDTNEYTRITATLAHVTEHAYFWIEDGVKYNPQKLEQLAQEFEQQIHPTTRALFGSEWSPGVDGEARIYILYARGLGSGIAGFFSSTDQVHPLAKERSNAHEMFYMSADGSLFGRQDASVLAHEYQHMIHFHQDPGEAGWVDEGLSMLSQTLNGYPAYFDTAFAVNPDVLLLFWDPDVNKNTARYGGTFLFMKYFLSRFGEAGIRSLAAEPEDDLAGVDAALAKIGAVEAGSGEPLGTEDLFLDWAVANYVLDGEAGAGQYTYADNASVPRAKLTEAIPSCPAEAQFRVNQFAADYVQIRCRGDFSLRFEGAPSVPLLPGGPHGGQFAFWSNQGDSIATSLTRSFDFRGHSGPLSLTYWMWYDLEEEYDYAYLEVSEDGQHWQILTTPSGTAEDPTGSAFGWGYNGQSGGWIQERVDLSRFAGKQVQLRFEYITDLGVSGQGLLLDDIAIPEIGYTADFERDEGGWQAGGFVRVQNALPQVFRLALVTRQREGTQVQVIPLEEGRRAALRLSLGSDVREAVLVVLGATRYTRQPASYRIVVE